MKNRVLNNVIFNIAKPLSEICIINVANEIGQKYLDRTTDVIQFLEFGKTESNRRKKVMIAAKSYSNYSLQASHS